MVGLLVQEMSHRLSPAVLCGFGLLGVLNCVVCPFPFCQPVSTAPATALVFPHTSAALWADQIDD